MLLQRDHGTLCDGAKHNGSRDAHSPAGCLRGCVRGCLTVRHSRAGDAHLTCDRRSTAVSASRPRSWVCETLGFLI